MTTTRVGTALVCVGALNALIGTIMLQLPTARVGFYPYVLLLSGLVLIFCGYFTGRRLGGK
jgi:hypothetical protein